MAISPYLFFDVTFSRSYRCWRGLGWMRKVFLSMLFHNNNLDRNSAKILAAYWACHVAYHLRISSNLLLDDQHSEKKRGDLPNTSHFLYKILDSKKTSRFQFSVPNLREIHRNLKQQKNFNSGDGFFRKSPFCTFSCINPGFGGPWGMLWIFFLIGIFIMLQKNTFGQKNFKFHALVPFWKNWKIAKMALFITIINQIGKKY